MRWAERVARMGKKRDAYRVVARKREAKMPHGRRRHRWEDNIKLDIKELGRQGMMLKHFAQNRSKWQAFVNTVMNLRCPQNSRPLLTKRLLTSENESGGGVWVCVGTAWSSGHAEMRHIWIGHTHWVHEPEEKRATGSLDVHKILQKPGVRLWNGFSWHWSPGGNFRVPSKVGNFLPIPAVRSGRMWPGLPVQPCWGLTAVRPQSLICCSLWGSKHYGFTWH